MKIYVSHTAWFERYSGLTEETCMELENGKTALNAASVLNIPADEIGFVSVNGSKREIETVLSDGDHLRIYPLILGG